MKKTKLFKRMSAGLLAMIAAISLIPQGGGLATDPVVNAANVTSGAEGVVGEVNINGYNTMYDYIKKDFTYTDQMTVNDYKSSRSASYDRNETATGKDSVDYLLQSVEWTDVDNGEALLSVAGKDTTDSVALYIFSTCRAQSTFSGYIVRDNLIDLLQHYDRVDAICIDNWALWDTYTSYTTMSDNPWTSDAGRNGALKSYSAKYVGSFRNLYTGICPVVSFYSEDYTEFKHSGCQVATDVTNYINTFEWGAGTHSMQMYLPAIKAYMTGDISYETWNTANSVNVDLHASVAGTNGTNVSPNAYSDYLHDLVEKSWNEDNIVNLPTAIYLEMSDFADCSDNVGIKLDDYSEYVDEFDYINFLATNYWDQSKWLILQSNSNYMTVGSAKEAAFTISLAAVNPRYVVDHYHGIKRSTLNSMSVYMFTNDFKVNAAQQRYYYSTPFLTGGIKMPDKQLAFDIPIGDSWQVNFKSLPKANIVYTYKYADTSSKAGQYCTTSSKGDKLIVSVSVDDNNIIHITTNTYVKGAEISIQIPLKYSANGVQSAKQLRVDENGHVYTDGKSGKPVDDLYAISMTSGDTKLHVGPDTLGDLDTSLSIYMPSNDLMDVKVNLHWMNDSDVIKGMLNDKSVRGNATALIGSDALVGNELGKQSDDDKKAGGIGTSVVALNFADAKGSVGTIPATYKDSVTGDTKHVANNNVDVKLRTKNNAPDLWTDAKDEAGEKNVVTYTMFNVPRFGHPTANTYDEKGNITSVRDLANGLVPRYYYVEDVVNVPGGYTAYNITNMASSDLAKLQKTTGSDTENPMTYNKALYYAYTVTPPSDWNAPSKVTYTIDCYVALDIKSLKMTVEHYQEQLTGDGYTPSTNKKYELESSIDSYEAITSVYSPEVKTYAGYDSPARQSMTVTVTGDHVIKYYYDLHYYDINVDTQGGEWYEEQDDGTWCSIPKPPAHYTILTPTFTLPIPDKVGFDFDGYTGTGLTKATKDVSVKKGSTGDRSYKANWTAQAYDVEVPVSLTFSAAYDGVMKGGFDQYGTGDVVSNGYLHNNSKFPVQVTHITYSNDSIYKMSDEKSDKPNIMNWRLDAVNGSNTYNAWATALERTVDVSDEETYWMAQNGNGRVTLDSDQAWYRNDVPDIKGTTKIGTIMWTFDIGHRNVATRSITAAK